MTATASMWTRRRMEATGLTVKTRVLDDRKTGPQEISQLRVVACDLINAALEEAGSDERVDHRSFAARGIDAEPTTHKGPGGTARERRDEPSYSGDINDEITAANQALDALVEELAVLNAEIAADEERRLDERFGAGLAGPEGLGAVSLPEPVWDLPIEPPSAGPPAGTLAGGNPTFRREIRKQPSLIPKPTAHPNAPRAIDPGIIYSAI